MEVNINNAFPIAIHFSFGPCVKSYNVITVKIENFTNLIIFALLRKPFFTTSVVLLLSLILVMTWSLSLVIVAGVFCSIVIIFMLEGMTITVVLVTMCFLVLFSIKLVMVSLSIRKK